jgi:hypothetical protein
VKTIKVKFKICGLEVTEKTGGAHFLMVYPFCAAQYDAARGHRIQGDARLFGVAIESSRRRFVN